MVDFTSRLGRRINRRIRHEKVIWLTTVDLRHRPQPRPVWFPHPHGLRYGSDSRSGGRLVCF